MSATTHHEQPDMLLRGATLWLGPGAVPQAGWMHCVGERIGAIGTDGSMAPDARYSKEISGYHVLPGLIDCHCHFGLLALLPRLGDASVWGSVEQALQAVADKARVASGRDEWLVFANMDHSQWRDPRPPSRQALDRASGGRPVFLVDISLHRGVLSTRALELVGLRGGAWIGHDDVPQNSAGQPTGLVWEQAFGQALFTMFAAVEAHIGEAGMDELMQQEAQRCLSMGLSHAHDAGAGHSHQQRLHRLGDHSTLGISWSIANDSGLLTPPTHLDGLNAIWPRKGPRAVKLYLDGGNRCAVCLPLGVVAKATLRAAGQSILRTSLAPFRPLLEQRVVIRGGHAHLPYLRFPSSQALLNTAAIFDDMGCRLQIHALGNTAVRQALEVVRTLKPAAGASLEHVMILGASDLDAFADVPVVASLQPGFIPHYADAIEAQGVIPSLHAFPLASLAKRGLKIAISSDAPCGHADPLHNIRCAVHRAADDGRQIDPREALDVSSAVAAASLGAAQAIGLRPSPLQAGACATFTLLNGHPLDPSSRVVETWIDGRCVWSASRDIDKISANSIQQET